MNSKPGAVTGDAPAPAESHRGGVAQQEVSPSPRQCERCQAEFAERPGDDRLTCRCPSCNGQVQVSPRQPVQCPQCGEPAVGTIGGRGTVWTCPLCGARTVPQLVTARVVKKRRRHSGRGRRDQALVLLVTVSVVIGVLALLTFIRVFGAAAPVRF